MNKELLQKAKEFIKDPDIIVNIFDLSVVYIGSKALTIVGYTQEDLDTKILRLTDIFGFSEKQALEKVWEHAEDHGTREFLAQTSKGKYQIKIEFFVFKFMEELYRVGKILESKKVE